MEGAMSLRGWTVGPLAAALAGAIALGGCAASTPDPEAGGEGERSAVAEGVAAEHVADDETVCQSERPTGSRIRRRVCRSERERVERRKRDQQVLREANRWGTFRR